MNRRNLFSAAGGLGLGLAPRLVVGGEARQESVTPILLVRGETPLRQAPALAWRVVRDVAEPSPDAAFERRALGFAVATAPFTSLLLTDEATGTAVRLAPGEAAFVREGTMQRRESLAADAESYLRIGLVSADAASDAGGDRLLFAGEAFIVPGGETTLGLYRVALETGDTLALPAVDETLVMVEQGDVALVDTASGACETLHAIVASDTIYAIRTVAPASTLIGARAATSVLLATIA